jgi:hypothetical protein
MDDVVLSNGTQDMLAIPQSCFGGAGSAIGLAANVDDTRIHDGCLKQEGWRLGPDGFGLVFVDETIKQGVYTHRFQQEATKYRTAPRVTTTSSIPNPPIPFGMVALESSNPPLY